MGEKEKMKEIQKAKYSPKKKPKPKPYIFGPQGSETRVGTVPCPLRNKSLVSGTLKPAAIQ